MDFVTGMMIGGGLNNLMNSEHGNRGCKGGRGMPDLNNFAKKAEVLFREAMKEIEHDKN